MQHAATPQQLPLSWNHCQSTSTSSGADAVPSAVKTTNAVLQRSCKHSKASRTFKQQQRVFVMLVIWSMETWRDKIKTVNEQNLKNVQIKKKNCVKDANSCGSKKIWNLWWSGKPAPSVQRNVRVFGWIPTFHTHLLIKPILICLCQHKAMKHD